MISISGIIDCRLQIIQSVQWLAVPICFCLCVACDKGVVEPADEQKHKGYLPSDRVSSYLYDEEGLSIGLLMFKPVEGELKLLTVEIDTNGDRRFDRQYFFPDFQDDTIVTNLSPGRDPAFKSKEKLVAAKKEERYDYGDVPVLTTEIDWRDVGGLARLPKIDRIVNSRVFSDQTIANLLDELN